MPTLLRIALALLFCGVLFAGVALLAIAEVVSGHLDGGRLALGAVALCALVLPPMLAGMFVSYWSWDASARRRLRISLTVLVVLQVAGGAALVVLARTTLLAPVVVLVVIAVALDPAAIAIGRVARRLELRRPASTPVEVPEVDLVDLRSQIRTGWRRGGIGAAIGLAIGVLLAVGLLVPLVATGSDAVRALVFIPGGAGLGASIGMLTVVLALGRGIRDLLGGDYTAARRISRAVSGKPEALSEDEEARAARYALIAPEWLRLQSVQSLVNSLAVTSIAASSLIGLAADHVPGVDWIAGLILAALLVTIVSALVVVTRRIRRVRAYAEAHPA